VKDSKMLNRRDFLKWSAAAVAAAPFATPRRLLAATAQEPAAGAAALVVIYLRGGADALHLFAPYGDAEYAAMRPTLALGEGAGLIPLDGTWGMHQALAPLQPLWDAKALAPIVCAGSPHPTRSHFDAQDWMEFAAPGDRTVRDGWLNRYLAASAKPDASEFRALGMQDLLPRSLRGGYPVLAVPSNLDRNQGEKTLDKFEDFYGDGSDLMEGGEAMQGEREDDQSGVVASGRMTIETLRRFTEIVYGPTAAPAADEERLTPRERRRRRLERERATAAQPASAYPSSEFGRRMSTIAKVLLAGEGLEVAGVDYGGWDDHTNAGAVEGRLPNRLNDLARGLAAFALELGPVMETTTVLVMTEFGRNVRENGNGGTDHGHGGAMLLLGGGVRGGQVHGRFDGLAAKHLYEGRDLPVTTDFRDVFAATLERSFGFECPKEFFPGHKPTRLKLF
jgi:uncharacterized protein (DUF1501 family)